MKLTGQSCPCSSGAEYAACCERLHLNRVAAKTAEQLMRSRYAAYALKLIDYLLDTTHPEKRNPKLREEITTWANAVEFESLDILDTWKGQATDKVGKVRFIARYHQNGEKHQLCELSRFRRVGKQWRYLDGEINTIQS